MRKSALTCLSEGERVGGSKVTQGRKKFCCPGILLLFVHQLCSLQVPSNHDACCWTTIYLAGAVCFLVHLSRGLSWVKCACKNSSAAGLSYQQESGHAVFVKFFHCVHVHVFWIWESLQYLVFGDAKNPEWLLKISWNYEGEYDYALENQIKLKLK